MTAFVRCLSCGGRLTSAAESLSDAQGRYVGWRCARCSRGRAEATPPLARPGTAGWESPAARGTDSRYA
jgi:tRNA(Ile2) C34 agmatinyltransferase TiaS